MPRKPPDRPRQRPGKRPPNRHPAGPDPRGFTGPGYNQLYSWMMPGLARAEKREFFNEVSGAVVLAAALIGAGLGYICLGWIGAAMGLAAGISAGGSYVEKRRFYRR